MIFSLMAFGQVDGFVGRLAGLRLAAVLVFYCVKVHLPISAAIFTNINGIDDNTFEIQVSDGH